MNGGTRTPRVKRLLVYSQDGTGLGHLRRALNIAGEVLTLEPRCAVLIVGDSPAIPFLAPRRGLDFVKLPTIVKTGAGDWRTGSLPLDVDRTLRLRAGLIAETFTGFRPDAVLVDHMPVGAEGELKPMLDRAASGRRPRLFLGLRDVLDAPGVVRKVWRQLRAYDYLALYDAVLVYGCREMYDAGAAYRLDEYARRLAYCSYATWPTRPVPVSAGSEPVVVATGGGGGDAYPLLRAFVDAFSTFPSRTRLRARVLTGPNMPAERFEELTAAATARSIEVVPFVPDARPLLRRAAAVVTMAGYNTLCEVIAARRRALVVPRAGPSAEQRLRSRVFTERGLVRAFAPEELSPDRLAHALLGVLGDEALPDERHIPRLDGAKRAADLIVGAAP
jgi:predicted glycosyltransferase